jgi:thiol-disulfide isomerase/thioredoxin
MKKIIFTAITVLALSIPVKAKQIIFNESFKNCLESANLSIEGSKLDNIVYWTFASPFANKQPDTAAIFSYYPSKGYSNAPDRTNPFIRLASSWQKIDETLDNWVVFDWQYGASATPNQNIVIGVLARIHPDSAWVTVGQIKGNQFSFMSGAQMTDINKMSAKIPASLISGKDSIQVAAYFNYSTNASLNFILLVDNFSLISFGDVVEQPRASLAITAPATIFNSSKDIITAKVFNEGALSINKLKLAYTVNGGDIGYQEKTLTSAETISQFGKISFVFNPGLVENSGDNHVKVWIAALNETEFSSGEGGDTVSFSVYMPNSKTDMIFPTKYLVEHFTASTCAPCLQYNVIMNPVYKELEEEGSLIYIKYPVNWPGSGDPYYVAEDAGVRAKFYNVSGVPTSYGNGTAFSTQAKLKSNVNGFVAKSYFNVEFDSACIFYKNTDENNIYIKYKIAANVTAEVAIHTVVFEKITYNNKGTNGENEFPHVTMKMFPDGKGNVFTLKRDSVYEFVYEYNMAETFMERINDLELVVFMQDLASKEIYHAAQRTVTYDTISESANETYVDILPIKVSPNPASEYVNIESPENARIFLYNSAGMPVYEGRVKAAATKKLSLAGYAKGIYVLKVVSDKGIATEKIIIQ